MRASSRFWSPHAPWFCRNNHKPADHVKRAGGGGQILLWCSGGQWGGGDGGSGISEVQAAGSQTQRTSSLTCEHAASGLNHGNATPSQAFERVRPEYLTLQAVVGLSDRS